MTIKVIVKGREIKMTRKEFLRRYGNRKESGYITKGREVSCRS